MTLGNSFAPRLVFNYNGRIGVGAKFKGNCFIQNNIFFTHINVADLYIAFKRDTWSRDFNTHVAIGDWLCGTVKLTKNADPDKYGDNSHCIGFDACSQFWFSNAISSW